MPHSCDAPAGVLVSLLDSRVMEEVTRFRVAHDAAVLNAAGVHLNLDNATIAPDRGLNEDELRDAAVAYITAYRERAEGIPEAETRERALDSIGGEETLLGRTVMAMLAQEEQ